VLTCPAILALHLAYGWAALGFGLLAIGTIRPVPIGEAAAIHVWTIGAIGGASLAIMIRRQTRKPFASSTALTIALASGSAATVIRLPAEWGGAPSALAGACRGQLDCGLRLLPDRLQ